MKMFTLYWLSGHREVVEGETIEQAFTLAGYGAGALKALDFFNYGDDHSYTWSKERHSWNLTFFEPAI